MHPRRTILLLCALASAALPLAAQPYARSPADTLRYREVTVQSSEVTMPDGVLSSTLLHDARMGVAFGAADTAWAWYEALTLRESTSSELEVVEPATAGALGKPFVLRFGPRGDVEVLSAPQFPAEVSKVTDLTMQFDDDFVRMPARPLEPGSVWTDTVVLEDSTSEFVSSARYIRHSRVRGDSVVDGEVVLVIATRTQLFVEELDRGFSDMPAMRTVQTGEELGTFLWSSTRGVLVGRQRTAKLSGTVQVLGEPELATFPIRRQYSSSLQFLH